MYRYVSTSNMCRNEICSTSLFKNRVFPFRRDSRIPSNYPAMYFDTIRLTLEQLQNSATRVNVLPFYCSIGAHPPKYIKINTKFRMHSFLARNVPDGVYVVRVHMMKGSRSSSSAALTAAGAGPPSVAELDSVARKW
jgi:hypothetical protein